MPIQSLSRILITVDIVGTTYLSRILAPKIPQVKGDLFMHPPREKNTQQGRNHLTSSENLFQTVIVTLEIEAPNQ